MCQAELGDAPERFLGGNPEGPRIEKMHSRSNAWKNHSPTHEIFILAWNFHSQFEIFILDWNFQSRALFFCSQRGARNEKTILDWKFYSALKAWFFQDCLSRLSFFNPGALWEFRPPPPKKIAPPPLPADALRDPAPLAPSRKEKNRYPKCPPRFKLRYV